MCLAATPSRLRRSRRACGHAQPSAVGAPPKPWTLPLHPLAPLPAHATVAAQVSRMSELVGAFDDADGSTDPPASTAAVVYYSVDEEALIDVRFGDLFAVRTPHPRARTPIDGVYAGRTKAVDCL